MSPATDEPDSDPHLGMEEPFAGPVAEFYQSFRLPLPKNLAMGHYRVKVTVTDAHSGKTDQVYVPIYVTAVESSQ